MTRENHKSWLQTCPCTDGNFKPHLQAASAREIADLIEELPEKGNKSKIAVLKRELRKRQYEVNTLESGEIKTSNTFHDYYAALEFYNSITDELKEFVEVNKDGYFEEAIKANY